MNSKDTKNNLFRLYSEQAGFTLVEILVAMGVFTLMVFAVSAIYIAFNSSQIRTTASQQSLNDAQYAIEIMTKEIKNNTLLQYPGDGTTCADFIHTSGSDVFTQCVVLEKENGQVIAFSTHNNGVDTFNSLIYAVLTCDDAYVCDDLDISQTAYSEILSESLNNIHVKRLDLFVSPSTDPFVSDASPNSQPRVTINLNMLYLSERQSEAINYDFQTTVSSRIYKK